MTIAKPAQRPTVPQRRRQHLGMRIAFFDHALARLFQNVQTFGHVSVHQSGFGRCEYQFQVHAVLHESRKIAIIAGAIRRG